MNKSFVILTYLVLLVGTSLVFWQVFNFNFVNYDDSQYVYENPQVLKGLSWNGVIWAFSTNCTANWHPLTWLSLMLDCQLFGANPSLMHLENLLLHIANTLLLFAVFRKITGTLWPSAFVAAAFAIHPMHVQSVVWIAERKDVLSTLFFLLTLAAYVSYVKSPGLLRYMLTQLLFALGLLVKPMLVTLPFLLLLLDYWPLGRFTAEHAETAKTRSQLQKNCKKNSAVSAVKPARYLVLEKIPFVVLAIISSVITFFAQLKSGAVMQIEVLSLKERAANAFLSYAIYIGKLFWPRNLAIFYPFDANKIVCWKVGLCALLLLVISIPVIRLGRSRKYLPVGWFWFVGTLVPVIGFVQVGTQAYADRYTYIPYVGLFIMLAWGLPEFFAKWPQRKTILGLSMIIALTILGICTYQQTRFWKNNLTLFSHAIEVTQNNYLAHNNLGNAYLNLGRYQDAIENYKQAIKSNPDYFKAYYNLGVAYGKIGRYEESKDACKQTIKIKPDYIEAYINLGASYYQLGDHKNAIETFKQSIKINPNIASAHYGLGLAYSKIDRWQDAVESYKQTIKIEPNHFTAYNNLGIACYKLGRYKDAIENCKQAVRIKPDYVLAHYSLGFVYLAVGDKNSALEEYKTLKTMNTEKANELLQLIGK